MITYDRLYLGGSWTEPSNPTLLEIASAHDRSTLWAPYPICAGW
ncbi:hypothetical protein [Nocardia sp. NPDC049707]